MIHLTCVNTRILLLIFTLIAFSSLPPRLLAQQDTEPKRTYTIDEKTLPKDVLEIVEVRNLNAENFPSMLEVEVKNVGEQPIYGILMVANFKGTITGMTLRFGRPALAIPTTTPNSEDKPLMPGEKGTLRVDAGIAKGTQAAIANGNLPVNQTLKVEFIFQLLSFGDGTGYQLTHKTGTKRS